MDDVSPLFLEPSQLATPAIPPLPAEPTRPFWSVMIPTYNCASFLRETLASVLRQDPGPEQMQIEVVDDGSTKDDPEAVVRELGQGRVAFYRQPANGGAIHNFNTCILRSRGQWVHILHGDDLVEPDFYERLGKAAAEFPQAALLATRSHLINEFGVVQSHTRRVPEYETFSTDPSPLFYENFFRTPAMVVRRSFYEQHGGFLPALVYTADWELWVRAITHGGVHMLDAPLARYRDFGGNDTSRLTRSGENSRDFLRFGSLLARQQPQFDHERFQVIVWLQLTKQIRRFRQLHDAEAVQANRQVRNQLKRLPLSPFWRLSRFVGSLPVLGPWLIALTKPLLALKPAKA